MSDTSQGPGWWLASDGRWYPPELWTGPPTAGPASPTQAPSYPTGPTMPAARPIDGAAPYGAGNLYPSDGDGHDARSATTTVPRTNGLAIASLICSCTGLFFLPIFPGVILGFVARSQIRRSNGTQRGDGLAIAGIIVGFGWLVLIALGLVIGATKHNSSVVGPAAIAGLTCLIGPVGLVGPFN